MTDYLDKLIEKLKAIRDTTKPIEPFISWSQLQDAESRRRRVSCVRNKLRNIKEKLMEIQAKLDSIEELNQDTIPLNDLYQIQSTLFKFCLFTGGIAIVFLAQSTLVDVLDSDFSKSDFSRLSIALGSILATDSLKFAEKEIPEELLYLIHENF